VAEVLTSDSTSNAPPSVEAPISTAPPAATAVPSAARGPADPAKADRVLLTQARYALLKGDMVGALDALRAHERSHPQDHAADWDLVRARVGARRDR
jgi:hypothetical protein